MKDKTICVDFDGTLCSEDFPRIGKRYLLHKIIGAYIKYLHKKGWTVVLYTLRDKDNKKYPTLLNEAVQACVNWNIPIDRVNENCIDATDYYGYARKIKGDIYLDDRNFGPFGWLLRTYNSFIRTRREKHELSIKRNQDAFIGNQTNCW